MTIRSTGSIPGSNGHGRAQNVYLHYHAVTNQRGRRLERYETTAYNRPTSAREVMLLFLLVGLPVCPPDYLKNNERICMKMEMIRITIRIQDPDYDH